MIHLSYYITTHTHLKHLVVSEWAVGHDHAVVELVQWSPPLGRLVVVAQFNQRATLLVEQQRIIGGHPTVAYHRPRPTSSS